MHLEEVDEAVGHVRHHDVELVDLLLALAGHCRLEAVDALYDVKVVADLDDLQLPVLVLLVELHCLDGVHLSLFILCLDYKTEYSEDLAEGALAHHLQHFVLDGALSGSTIYLEIAVIP